MFDEYLFETTLKDALGGSGLALFQEELNQMTRFALKIVTVNQSLNLTRILEPQEMAIKNFFDSLTLLLLDLPSELKVLDVGTGAGFPGIPLAIARPNWSCTLLDSLSKRLRFLDEVASELDLSNVRTLHARAEDVGQDSSHRESYDLVVSRAVANLAVLLELCTPMVKTHGCFVAFKAGEVEGEIAEAKLAMDELNVSLEQAFPLKLPLDLGERSLLVFRKFGQTDSNYPRRAGIPSKRPLI